MNENQLKHLAITCGGTGGHFNPGLSIAQTLNAQGGEAVLLLGGKHADKQLKIAADCGVRAYKIKADPRPRNPFKLFGWIAGIISGARTSRKIMKEHQVQALLSMGSYTSIPPAIAALTKKLPFFLHDGNARLGKANLFMSRFAKGFAFSFPSVNAANVKCPAVLTGFPLRAALLQARYTREEAIRQINQEFQTEFESGKPLLLVFGGSLGAEKINTSIDFDSDELQIIHLAGPGKLDQVNACYAGRSNRILTLEAYENIALLYTAADFVISRAGGSTVSELAYFGKYALLIPYPHAADLHQNDNAALLASAGGAEIILDSDCSKTLFRSILSNWIRNKPELIAAGEKNRSLAMPDAAANVLRMIETYLQKK